MHKAQLKKIYFYLIFFVSTFLLINYTDVYALEDANYIIRSAKDTSKVLDVAYGSISDESNIQLYVQNDTPAQLWYLKKEANDYYTISIAQNSDYVLTIEKGNFQNGANVSLAKNRNLDTQKWKLVEDDAGYYTIYSYDSNFVLDIEGIQSGSNVLIKKEKVSTTQKFILTRKVEKQQVAGLRDGIYKIKIANSNQVLDVFNANLKNTARIIPNIESNSFSQLWYIHYLNNGYYSIRSFSNMDYVFDVVGGSLLKSAPIQLFSSNNSAAQQWILKEENGGYQIVSRASGLALDSANNTIFTNHWDGSNNQIFSLEEASAFSFSTIEEADYFVRTAKDTSKVLDVAYGIVANRNNVQLYAKNDTLAQVWHFQRTNDGYYTISTVKDSNYVLTVAGNFQSGTNVELLQNNNLNSQKWRLIENASGYFTIYSYDFNYVLDIKSGSTNSGANVQIYKNNGTLAQKFVFTKRVEAKQVGSLSNGIYKIKGVGSNQVLDIVGGSLKDTARITSNVESNSLSQLWYLQDLNNGYYSIRAFSNMDYVFDVTGGSLLKNAHIQLFTSNNSAAQQWILKEENGGYQIISRASGLTLDHVDETVFTNHWNGLDHQLFTFESCNDSIFTSIEDDDYIITTSKDVHKVLDVTGGVAHEKSNVQLYVQNNTPAQIWHFTKTSDGYYSISTTKDSNYVLSVTGIFKSGANVELSKNSNLNSQKWRLIEDDFGYYTIYSYDYNYVLDITSGSTNSGANVQIYKNNGTPAQKFSITSFKKGSKVLEDGIYEILTQDQNVLSIHDKKVTNFSNIEVAPKEDILTQKWQIKYLNNGYYSIKVLSNINYSLDVVGAGKLKNTNVHLYAFNGSDAQQWIIEEENGHYRIISKNNGLSLEIVNHNALVNKSDAQNINQQFQINRIICSGSKVIDDGYYTINSMLTSKKSLDIQAGNVAEGTNVQLFTSNSTLAQKWHIKYLDNGYYAITSNQDDQYALTYDEASNNVKISKFYDLETQHWVITKNSTGGYTISNSNFLNLTVAGGKTANGTNIELSLGVDNNSVRFHLTPTAEGVSKQLKATGYYYITSAMDENYTLDLSGAGTSNGTNIQLYQKNYTKAQKWYLSYNGDGYYTITASLDRSKAMDVDNGYTVDGTNVHLYSSNNSYAQQWVLKDAGDDCFYLVSNSNGLYLDVDQGTADNRNNIEMNHFTGATSQKFKFEKTRFETLVIDISSHQGDIDWDIVKKEAGIFGVMVRVSAGSLKLDSKFERNVQAIKRLGIPYGLYIYSYADNQYATVSDLGYHHEAKLEALRVIKAIKDYDLNPTLGIYYDLEHWDIKGNEWWESAQYEPLINNFGNTMSQYGYSDWRIYANLSMANSVLSPWKDRITWIAQWNDHCSYDGFYNLWQFTSDGYLPGINGRVDLNYYYFD